MEEDRRKEFCRRRIKILQNAKECLTKEINPLLDKKTADLYKQLESKFNEIVDLEAKFLV